MDAPRPPSADALDPSPFSPEVGHRSVGESCITTFGCLTGDYARMHFDRDLPREPAGRGRLAHGLLSASWSLGALTLHAPERLGVGDPEAWIVGYSIRFLRPVEAGDRFSLRHRPTQTPAVEGLEDVDGRHTEFEILDRRGQATCRGAVSVAWSEVPMGERPRLALAASSRSSATDRVLHAEDMLAHGPRGESLGRTLTEADVVAWTGFTGELDPAYLNAEHAARGRFGSRIVPPMLVFCLGFGDFLRDLLQVPMPATGFAGHLGDRWRCLAPVRAGDTIRTRHAPIACTPSRSRPDRAIVEFGLELSNQHDELVQTARVAMMMPRRDR